MIFIIVISAQTDAQAIEGLIIIGVLVSVLIFYGLLDNDKEKKSNSNKNNQDSIDANIFLKKINESLEVDDLKLDDPNTKICIVCKGCKLMKKLN